MKEIPIIEAKMLSKKYGYDQIIILGLSKSKKAGWFDGWGTTFNSDKTKCSYLGKIAELLSYNLRCYYSTPNTTDNHYKMMKVSQRKDAEAKP